MDVDTPIYKSFSLKRSSLNAKFNNLISNTTTPRMKKRTNIPSPLKLQPLTPPPTIKKQKQDHQPPPQQDHLKLDLDLSLDLDWEITSSIDFSPSIKQFAKKSYINKNCCICEEPLLSKLSNERIIELNCDHQAHHDCCFYILQDKEEEEGEEQEQNSINCSICNTKTSLKDDSLLEAFHMEKLINTQHQQTNSETTLTPFTPQQQIIESYGQSGFKSPIMEDSQSFTNSSNSTKYHEDLEEEEDVITPMVMEGGVSDYSIEDLITPKVQIIPETTKLIAPCVDSCVEFTTVVNVTTGKLNSTIDTDDEGLRTKINNKIIKNLVGKVSDFKGLSPQSFQGIKLFDYLEISLDGVNWEHVQFYIFDTSILILNHEGSVIVGSIILEHFHTCVQDDPVTITLTFHITTVPELMIRTKNKIMLSKYCDFFHSKLSNNGTVPLVQITTNAWLLVSDDCEIKIPEEVIQYNELSAKGLDLPFGIMEKLLPRPERLPINLIISISLVNITGQTNQEYLQSVKGTLREILRVLNPRDKLGLVILGRNGARECGPHHSSFFGMIGSSWCGWEDIIEELSVFTMSEPIDEMNIALKTCDRLMKTQVGFEERSIKQIQMIGSFGYSSGGIDDQDALERLYAHGFSIKQIIIGGVSTRDGLLHDEMEKCSVGIGGFGVDGVYGSLDDFTRCFEGDVYERLSQVLIPLLEFQFDTTSGSLGNFVKICGIERNCHIVEVVEDKMHVKILNVNDGYYTNFQLKFKIDLIKLQNFYSFPINEYIEIPVTTLSYKVVGREVSQIFNIKLKLIEEMLDSVLSPIKSFFAQESTESDTFMDIPIYAPLSSSKDSIFALKQMEMTIIESLEAGKISIDEIISLVYFMKKEFLMTNRTEIFGDNTRISNDFPQGIDDYVDKLIRCLTKLKTDDRGLVEFVYCFKNGDGLRNKIVNKLID